MANLIVHVIRPLFLTDFIYIPDYILNMVFAIYTNSVEKHSNIFLYHTSVLIVQPFVIKNIIFNKNSLTPSCKNFG